MINIGFMQGRLCDQVGELIQAFPFDSWQKEFEIAWNEGFSLMEWTLDAKDLKENPLMKSSGRSKIRALSKKFGVKIVSLTGDCFMQEPFWKIREKKSMDRLLEDFLSIVEACSIMGIRLIVIPLVDNGSISCKTEENIVVEQLSGLSSYLRKKKVEVAFETDFDPEKNKKFISKFSRDTFGINYDCGNSASLGYSAKTEFKLFSDHIKNVHIKDRKYQGTTVPLGKGDVNFPEIFSGLKSFGYNGNLILQTARAEDGDHVSTLNRYKKFVENGWMTCCS